jgi:NADH-quinone oxidoreductase subunit L
MTTTDLMTLAPALPLVAAIVTALFGRKLGKHAHWPALVCVALAFVCSLALLRDTYKGAIDDSNALRRNATPEELAPVGIELTHTLYRWVGIENALGNADFVIDVTLRLDPLTAIMLSMVTFISTLVVLYSIGYMHDDPGYARFFATVALFVFSMMMLVSVSNFILLYVFWEAVGACSYLLIGFWFQKPEAAAAGKKAFLVNRVGDFAFAIGLFLIWTTYGTLNFHDTKSTVDAVTASNDSRTMMHGFDRQIPLSERDAAWRERNLHAVNEAQFIGLNSVDQTTRGVLGASRLKDDLYIGGGIATAICLLLMLGACGKSAQFPLHVWLPDAMEGPTPVSALIHAATMVTAGVYMVTRCMPLFMASEDARLVVSTIGAITALLAGLIALTQNDLKRVLAYSTVSQLGYMFLALGTGSLAGVFAGMFHLFTHAFFKACLFLGAGSVMHAMGGVIDMRRFSGLRKIMPVTHWTFLAGCLALAGFPFLSGFWSKDAILAAVHSAGGQHAHWFHYLYYAALGTAFLTAFYTFRAFFMTFYGEEHIPHEAGHHAHESPSVMTVPLVILGILAIAIGYIAEHPFLEFLRLTPSLANAAIVPDPGNEAGKLHWDIAAVSSVIALLGIGIAAFMYLGNKNEADALAKATGSVGLYQLSRDKFYIDEIYALFIVWPLRIAASFIYLLDRYLVDGLVNFVGRIPPTIGSLVRPLQNGLVQFYALAMVLGVLTLIGVAYWVQS